MPYPADHRERTRERIVRAARVLFNRHGFDRVSIDDVMKHAGLTRGGFYRHFDSKSDLYAEAISFAIADTPWSRWDGVDVDFSAADAAQQLVHAYLSEQHLDDIDASCPMVALPSEVSRADPKVKRAFEGVFMQMVQLLEHALRDRSRALAIAGICVGGMVVARGIADAKLAEELRAATLRTALRLGDWSPRRKRRSR
jgi:AcrR family transcriptional regulator